MFLDVFIEYVAYLTDELDVFCGSFEFFIVDLLNINLIHVLFLKGDSNSKNFSVFVFYFNASNKIFSTPSPSSFYEALKSRLIWICRIL